MLINIELRDIHILDATDFINPNQVHGLRVEMVPPSVIEKSVTKKKKVFELKLDTNTNVPCSLPLS